jgi:uncharacterized membrane protein (DUF485 family)
MAKSTGPKGKMAQRPKHISANSQAGEGIVKSVLVAMASIVASLIAFVSALVASGATQATAIPAVAIIATIVGAFTVAGIYVWRDN